MNRVAAFALSGLLLGGCNGVDPSNVGSTQEEIGTATVFRCEAQCLSPKGKSHIVHWRDCQKDEDAAEADGAAACANWKKGATLVGSHGQCMFIRDHQQPKGCKLPNGGGTGDPHLFTFDGLRYDYQPIGEFVYATDNQTYTIQVRTEQWIDKLATLQTALSTRFADGTKVSLFARQTPMLVVNDQAAQLDCWDDTPVPAGQLCSGHLELDNGGWIDYDANAKKFSVNFPDAVSHLDVSVGNSSGLYFNTQFFVGPAIQAHTVGLLGSADGDASNDLVTRDGTVMKQPVSFHDLYNGYANSWRISDNESLFVYDPGKSTATFTDPAFPKAPYSAADLPAADRDAARAACATAGVPLEALDECAMDSVVLGGNAALDFVHIGRF